jgi:hypothetical protein
VSGLVLSMKLHGESEFEVKLTTSGVFFELGRHLWFFQRFASEIFLDQTGRTKYFEPLGVSGLVLSMKSRGESEFAVSLAVSCVILVLYCLVSVSSVTTYDTTYDGSDNTRQSSLFGRESLPRSPM